MFCAAVNINVLLIRHFLDRFLSPFVDNSTKFNQKCIDVGSTGSRPSMVDG